MIELKEKCRWKDLKIGEIFAWGDDKDIYISCKINFRDGLDLASTINQYFIGGFLYYEYKSLENFRSSTFYKLSKSTQKLWKGG